MVPLILFDDIVQVFLFDSVVNLNVLRPLQAANVAVSFVFDVPLGELVHLDGSESQLVVLKKVTNKLHLLIVQLVSQ